MHKNHLAPPSLPPPLIDEDESAVDLPTLDSTWDTLALTALDLHYSSLEYGNRRRVRWVRFALLKWCCHRPMRIGAVEYQPKARSFGWEQKDFKFAACRHCGRIKGYVL